MIDTSEITKTATAGAAEEPLLETSSFESGPPEAERERVPATAVFAAAASAAAAAWMVGGLFKGFTAHLISLLGVAIGAGLVLIARKGGRYRIAEFLVIPTALVVGAALLLPETRAGTSTIGGLIRDAVGRGGFLQTPVAFDPGWRFLLVVLFALVSAAAAGISVGLGKPKLGVGLPGVLIMGAATIQPKGSELSSAAVALALTVIALTLAFSVELGRDGRLTAAFEMPRLIRAGGIAAGLAAGIIALNSLSFLFPQPDDQHVIPPQKPHLPPALPDRPLFSYQAPRPLPLRLGVLDTYDVVQNAWLLPGYDTTRLRRLEAPAPVPGVSMPNVPTVTVSFTLADARGHTLPSIAGLQSVGGAHIGIDYDPVSDGIALADRPVFRGFKYSVVGAALDRVAGRQLGKASAPEKSLAPFMVAPPAPNQVVALLSSCAERAAKLGVPDNTFDRLQCVRQGLYDKVVAAGAGTPIDLPPSRVAQMLDGGDASPYEITASEALLARWASVPSRIGYGYYGGEVQKDGSRQIRPKDGAMWIEVYFKGYGWVPIVGVPPKAKPSTSLQQKKQVNSARDDRIQMMIYIPIRQPNVILLFTYVRYYIMRFGPPLLALGLLLFGYPWVFKVVRTRRRRRWAARNGLTGRIAVAYAEFRDRARDLGVGEAAVTPLRFLRFVEFDKEHKELAWLVTRGLWGDLRRDLREEDAQAAEEMATSVARRLDRAQPTLNRGLARIARTSLMAPFSNQVPNVWREFDLRSPLRALRRLPRALLRLRKRRAAVAGATMLVLLLSSCSQAAMSAPRTLDDDLVPNRVGVFEFRRERGGEKQFAKAGADALVSTGRLYSIHRDNSTEGSIELALFKPDVSIEDINDEEKSGECTVHPEACPGHDVLRGFQASLGSGHLHRLYYRDQRAYEIDLPDQRLYVWFPKGKETIVILSLLSHFTASGEADRIFHGLLDHQLGAPAVASPVTGGSR